MSPLVRLRARIVVSMATLMAVYGTAGALSPHLPSPYWRVFAAIAATLAAAVVSHFAFRAYGRLPGGAADGSGQRDVREPLLETEALLLRTAIEQAAEAAVITDSSGRIEYVNPAAATITGYAREELLGQNPRILKSGLHDTAFYREMWNTLLSGGVWSGDITNRCKDGRLSVERTTIAPVVSEGGAITHFVALKQDVTQRKSDEVALRASEERYRQLVQRNLAGVYRSSLDGRVLECNDAFARIFGYGSRGELLSGSTIALHPMAQARSAFLETLRREGSVVNYESEGRRTDGESIRLIENAVLAEGDVIDGTVIDVTSQRKLETQLRQVQKMEAIGRLAGGVAHDFNNLLGVINGYGEMVLKRMAESDALRPKVAQIVKAGERAAGLTRQLLAFSRQQVLQPKTLDLNAVVSEMEPMLRRLIGEDIELEALLDPQLGSIKADPGQIEQIVMNLAVNARDAMPDGGRLTIETRNADLDAEYAAQHPPTTPGRYAMLAMSDTGSGMDAQVQAHIFEPFFTTKGPTEGTGLGLATVYGVVKQSGGFIWVYSEVGVGTTFKIYLPRTDAATEPVVELAPAPLTRGGETVLLVEDEAGLRDLLREMLEASGYVTLVARDGAEALQIVEGHKEAIDVLVTDVIMPGMTGRAAADVIKAAKPGIKVLYLSGYSDSAIVRHGVLSAGSAFLSKPFASEALLRKVRELLDSR